MKSGGGEQFIATTGVKQKRVASESVTSSDLCFEAAEKLIAELNWEKAEIDALVFVTQSPDYRTPASSCILQDRLGLPQSCFTLDISLGCSGWVYGLSISDDFCDAYGWFWCGSHYCAVWRFPQS